LKPGAVSIPGHGVTLEGVWHFPKSSNALLPAVIVCHPHPLYGGSMDNNVVITICEGLADGGLAALRFNFRGVGNSSGGYSGGTGEQDDVRATIDFAAAFDDVDPSRLGLAGYSFGGGLAIPVAADDPRVRALALVSPAAEEKNWQRLPDYSGPRLILAGGQDEQVPLRTIQRFVEDDDLNVIDSADHFWYGHETTVTSAVTGFFSDILTASRT
jgi:uncharacterized protein